MADFKHRYRTRVVRRRVASARQAVKRTGTLAGLWGRWLQPAMLPTLVSLVALTLTSWISNASLQQQVIANEISSASAKSDSTQAKDAAKSAQDESRATRQELEGITNQLRQSGPVLESSAYYTRWNSSMDYP